MVDEGDAIRKTEDETVGYYIAKNGVVSFWSHPHVFDFNGSINLFYMRRLI